MSLLSKEEAFLRDGWIIVDIPQPAIIHEYADMLEKKARALTGSACTLANIHEHVDDVAFKTLHTQMAEYFWESEFSLRAGTAFLSILKDMIGLDIMVQYMPYLRLARPNRPEDNIGYHKDTQYGQTPYELAVHVPFVDLDADSSLIVISGSHLAPESDYQSVAGITTHVTKGSTDHMLGKPYAPKICHCPKVQRQAAGHARGPGCHVHPGHFPWAGSEPWPCHPRLDRSALCERECQGRFKARQNPCWLRIHHPVTD